MASSGAEPVETERGDAYFYCDADVIHIVNHTAETESVLVDVSKDNRNAALAETGWTVVGNWVRTQDSADETVYIARNKES